MAVIEETFGPRKYELIRDRIAEIVADELASQSTKNSDPNLNAKVWLERLVPMSQQELPAVNVFAADGKFERFTTESQTGEYTFAVDVFTRGATEGSADSQRGDLISTKKMMRLVGVLQAVLSHWKYCKLGFAENFIDRVEVQNFKLMEPVKAADNSNVAKGRIVLFVKAEETLDPKTPNLIDGYDTAVKLYETEFGYVYSGNQSPIPPPVNPAGEVWNTASVKLGDAPSGGNFVVDDSNVSNSDDSYSVDLPATDDLELPDVEYNIFVNGTLNQTITIPALKNETIIITN